MTWGDEHDDYEITAEQKQEIKEARRENKDKRVDAKLKVPSLRADGLNQKRLVKQPGFTPLKIDIKSCFCYNSEQKMETLKE